MKTTVKVFAVCALFAFLAAFSGDRAQAKTPNERINGAVEVLRDMEGQEDVATMGKLLSKAKGVAIFPSVIKAGLVIGGQYGEGFILRRNPDTNAWYGPNFVNITGASWGLQIGVQSIALVLVITNDRGMQGFMGNNVKLSGDLSVAAGPVGRHAEAGTDYKLGASIYSYTMTKGLFAGISLEGAVVDVDEEANSSYWGAAISARTALDKTARDSRIQPVLREIEKLMSLGKK